MAAIRRLEHSIVVHVPVRTAYNQWTQFESFPAFMQGVEEALVSRPSSSSSVRGLPVELLLRKLSARLTRADLQAAMAYAADSVAHEETAIVTPRRAAR